MKTSELKALPKVELHCHLDGSLSLKAIRQLAKIAKLPVPETDDALKPLVQVQGQTKDLLDYLKHFDFVAPLLKSAPALKLAAYDVLEQAANENVKYMEVRFAPVLSRTTTFTMTQAIEAVIAGLKQGEMDFGIHANLLVCGMRQLSNDENIEAFTAAQPFLGEGLGGVDFAGDEANFPPEDLTPAINFAKVNHLPLTLHAGECRCPQNIAMAVKLGAKRIGHGTALWQDPTLVQILQAHHTCLELCLTSNLQTQAIDNIENYPYQLIVEHQLNACINTDNRTVSNTTLTQEYELFQTHFHTDKAQFLKFNLAGIQAAFCSDKLKSNLTQAFIQAYQLD